MDQKKLLVLLVQIYPQFMCFHKLCFKKQTNLGWGWGWGWLFQLATEKGRVVDLFEVRKAEVSLYETCETKTPWLADDDRKVRLRGWTWSRGDVKCLFLGYVLAYCYKGLHVVLKQHWYKFTKSRGIYSSTCKLRYHYCFVCFLFGKSIRFKYRNYFLSYWT